MPQQPRGPQRWFYLCGAYLAFIEAHQQLAGVTSMKVVLSVGKNVVLHASIFLSV